MIDTCVLDPDSARIASIYFLVDKEVMNSAATGSCSKFMN